jgi:hypothetical protein
VCFAAVADHARDLALVQTAATLGDAQSFHLDEHERDELYARAVATALLGLCRALELAPRSRDAVGSASTSTSTSTSDAALAELIGGPRLWKTASVQKTPAAVRAAAFTLLGASIVHAPGELAPSFKR